MASMKLSRRMAAAPAAVFAVYSDFPNAAEHITGITKVKMLTDGPVGKGTRFEETRVMFGKEATETLEVSTFEPGKRMTLSCYSCGVEYDSTFEFVPDGDGTRVELTMVATPKTLGAKIMSPIMHAMMGKMMRKCMEADFDDVQKRLEGAAAAG